MEMTHYMELLASNQPWNLIVFMAIPVILAEAVAITELYLLFTRKLSGPVKKINSVAGALVGVYFVGVFLYLMNTAVIPLTMSGQWRGYADVIAVGFYLAGVLPLGGLALLEFGLIKRKADAEDKLKLHAVLVAVFLVVAHVAMIFGMLNPTVTGWVAPNADAASSMMMEH